MENDINTTTPTQTPSRGKKFPKKPTSLQQPVSRGHTDELPGVLPDEGLGPFGVHDGPPVPEVVVPRGPPTQTAAPDTGPCLWSAVIYPPMTVCRVPLLCSLVETMDTGVCPL